MRDVLLDTNIIVDIALARMPYYDDAKIIFQAAQDKQIAIYMSASSITDVYYIISNKIGNVLATGFITNLIEILNIVTVSKETILAALALGWKDFEDAVQYSAGAAVTVSAIVTRNPKDYSGSEIPVLSPQEFVLVLSNQ
jgi:predicted nucleic acid-binding protein